MKEYPEELVHKFYSDQPSYVSKTSREYSKKNIPIENLIDLFGTENEPETDSLRRYYLEENIASLLYSKALRRGNIEYLHDLVPMNIRISKMSTLSTNGLMFFGDLTRYEPLENKILYLLKVGTLIPKAKNRNHFGEASLSPDCDAY